ncbi:STAS domain-containing protein [Candidatus Methylopumilus planktonicus]|jgi:phospholipid transport system transporter-binding protein|uniref:STAS domain-containing protein n=1 Tax=Candidatus Methylopumilus planktonicus TaxID=1581557 RepID=UPI00111E80A3|nr:STAS domain-containing protein [Candidatus Methylopumilus planktonicus]MDH4407614.1 STAS domain-containing protein [Candidatus Methylopumilus sp.]QDD10401.1 STAS domain-containing protein [Candidatus Methylopumilus planktonicus]QDD22871.1 STAS domain-containing protein [Candidatus Methylopumilus planktonicus]
MIDFDKSQWNLSGDLTIEKIPTIIDLIKKQKTDKKTTIDFSKVTSIDTSTLSLIFELQREAKKNQSHFTFKNLPKNLNSLAKLYGVEDLVSSLH